MLFLEPKKSLRGQIHLWWSCTWRLLLWSFYISGGFALAAVALAHVLPKYSDPSWMLTAGLLAIILAGPLLILLNVCLTATSAIQGFRAHALPAPKNLKLGQRLGLGIVSILIYMLLHWLINTSLFILSTGLLIRDFPLAGLLNIYSSYPVGLQVQFFSIESFIYSLFKSGDPFSQYAMLMVVVWPLLSTLPIMILSIFTVLPVQAYLLKSFANKEPREVVTHTAAAAHEGLASPGTEV